jgi:hypothetical protein
VPPLHPKRTPRTRDLDRNLKEFDSLGQNFKPSLLCCCCVVVGLHGPAVVEGSRVEATWGSFVDVSLIASGYGMKALWRPRHGTLYGCL